MADRILTLGTADRLGQLINAVCEGRKATWAIDGDVTRLMTGVLRHFVVSPDNFAFFSPRDDVRDAYVRISAGMEWTLPVSAVLDLMDQSLFIIERGNQ